MTKGALPASTTPAYTTPDQGSPTNALDPTKPGPLVQALIDALHERDLTVRATRKADYVLIRASQPTIEAIASNNRGTEAETAIANSPGLSQELVLTTDTDRLPERRFAWSLLWGTELRNTGPADLERIANGEDIETAADLIAKILYISV